MLGEFGDNVHKNDKYAFHAIENDERNGKNRGKPSAFWLATMFHQIHLEVSIGFLPDFIIHLPKEPLLPEKIAVKYPET